MRYTRLLAEALGLIIYGTAQIHDQPIHEVFDEAKKILSEVENCPERLFQNAEDVKYFKCGAPVDSPPYPECCTLRAGVPCHTPIGRAMVKAMEAEGGIGN